MNSSRTMERYCMGTKEKTTIRNKPLSEKHLTPTMIYFPQFIVVSDIVRYGYYIGYSVVDYDM